MSLLFDRHIGFSFGIKGEEGKKVTGLRTVFDIKKDSSSEANEAKISIYNLASSSWGILENTKSKLSCILEIGYKEEGLKIIFKGDITKASRIRQGADIITNIEAKDGHVELTEAKLDKSYAAGVDEKKVIIDLLNTIKAAGNVTLGSLSNLQSIVSKNGLNISGISKDFLDKLIKKQGLEWSIQDNVIQVLESKGYTEEEAIILNKNTGLIGNAVKREKGIEFTALIQEGLKPGRLVSIESFDISGDFRIRKAKIKGDNYGNDWYAKCEAV